ncbi:MAG: hypothetical protein IIZ67_06660 [Bacilli bacterium]|nr:hypothetical protein [Bacilli bacterium]
MKITKEENGNIRISGLNLLGKLREGKAALKSKRGEIKEKISSESSNYRITREDNKLKIKREKEKKAAAPVEVVESEPVRTEKKTPRKMTDEEIEAIYKDDVAKASNKRFMPSLRDGYITYWELMNGSVVKRFGKYEEIKDKPNIAIRRSDIKEIELIELGKSFEDRIKELEKSEEEFSEYNRDVEIAKEDNNNEVPSMREGYVVYYDTTDNKLIKRFGKYIEVIQNPNYYIKYDDRNYYKELHKRMRLYQAGLDAQNSNENLEQYHKDISKIYEELKYYPTAREGYVSYYKNDVKRFGKYEDIANDSEVIIDDEDRIVAEDYVDLERQIANLTTSVVEDQDLEERNNHEEEQVVEEAIVEDDDLDLEEAIVEETDRLLDERDGHEEEQVVEETIVEDDDLDLEDAIVEETDRMLSERENLVVNDYGRLEDLNLSDDEKEYFEKLAEEYIGYLENPTEFKFEKEYKVRSKY